MLDKIQETINSIKGALNPAEWCNSWGRRMGVRGNTNHGIPVGYDDDLDAFRHAFANAVIVAYNPLDVAGIDKAIASLLGMLNEVGNPEHRCSFEMDIYNNKVGRDLAPSSGKMISWYKEGKNFNEEIAKIIAIAVKSRKTINALGDPRMSGYCQAKYNKKPKKPQKLNKKSGKYIWRTAGDGKVRFSHAMKNGKIFDWNCGGENPGDAYGCRCAAELVSVDMDNVIDNEFTYFKKLFKN